MANELSLLSNNSRRKRQIKQRRHLLEVQEVILAVEYNDLEAAWRNNIILSIYRPYRRYRRQHNTVTLMNSKFTRKICAVHNVWSDEWSDVIAKHATHGITQAAKQSPLSYNQVESLNEDNQQDRYSLDA